MKTMDAPIKINLSAAALPVPSQAITCSLMVDDAGKEPAYCLMVAYRSESAAREALALLGTKTVIAQQASPAATPCDAVRSFRDYISVHEISGRMNGQAMDDMALDLARIALDFQHLVKDAAPQAPTAPKLPLAESALSDDECMRWLAVINPLLKYAGSPGDWGYGSKLGLLTKHLYQVRAELEQMWRREAQ